MSGIHAGDLRTAVEQWQGDALTGAYLWWWSAGKFGVQPSDRWQGRLAGRTVELRGPADHVEVEADLLARILRGVETDPTCDIAYCNVEFWPRVDKSERFALVSKWDQALQFPYGRRIWDSEPLFAPGHFNMVPAAMLDLLTGAAKVTITGATFYALGDDYADGSPRNTHKGIWHHRPDINRRIIKNLWDAGAVAAEGLTAEVLSWSDGEYLERLEAHRL